MPIGITTHCKRGRPVDDDNGFKLAGCPSTNDPVHRASAVLPAKVDKSRLIVSSMLASGSLSIYLIQYCIYIESIHGGHQETRRPNIHDGSLKPSQHGLSAIATTHSHARLSDPDAKSQPEDGPTHGRVFARFFHWHQQIAACILSSHG